MHRVALVLTTVAALLTPSAVSAQASLPRAYMLDMKVDPAGIPAWIEFHQNHGARILEALVEDGAMLAFDLWVRHTGGKYNLRYNYILPSFGAVAEAGGRFMQRVDSASAAAMGGLALASESTDGIWYIGESNIPDDRPQAPYVYESALQIENTSIEQWRADFVRFSQPRLERAMEEGLITAWARLDHSIGGPWNTKIVLWMTSWDAIENVGDLLHQSTEEADAAPAPSSVVLGRTDMIWTPIPPSGS
jgi:hypothetical protein